MTTVSKKIPVFLLGFMFSCWTGCASNGNDDVKAEHVDPTFINPVGDGQDPWTIKIDQKYYTISSTGRALVVTESKYMTRIEKSVVVWNAPASGWNAESVWAPELHFLDHKWYIYYAAGAVGGAPFIHQRSGVLEADSPFGPYVDKGILIAGDDPNDASANVWAIDVTILEHLGKRYAIWSGWDKQVGTDQTPQHTYIAPMTNPWTFGKRTKLSGAEASWELGEAFGLQEGHAVLKHGSDVYIVYSTRGSWTLHYKLGLLRLKHAQSDLEDPGSWEKIGPVFQGTSKVYGVGHCSFTKSPDGQEDWIVYHSKKFAAPGWERDVRMQKFVFGPDGIPVFGEPVLPGKLNRPSGEYEIEIQSLK